MACMEHECLECGDITFNNKQTGGICKCGAYHWASTFDEEPGKTIIRGWSNAERDEAKLKDTAIERDMQTNKRYECEAYRDEEEQMELITTTLGFFTVIMMIIIVFSCKEQIDTCTPISVHYKLLNLKDKYDNERQPCVGQNQHRK